ncbi:MAG: NgoFVII family restriction endonuclease [Bacteroides sp.]|nr:NgoFVII family restriction endonuclease [Bacteroides sp.]
MELLFSKNPILRSMGNRSIEDFYGNCVERADILNIATGFITNDSIAELSRILSFHEFRFSVNLLIGMHYINGFTELQYNSIRRLNDVLLDRNAGHIYLSTNALFHGKMYSFMKGNKCIGAFLGSSNLGSFVGTSNDMIEADVVFEAQEAYGLNQKIIQVIDVLGTPFADAPEITKFKDPEQEIFKDYPNVNKISNGETEYYRRNRIGQIFRIPLKSFPKSHLNTYFGAGKIKGRFSRRDWYEVELILSKKLPNRDILPWIIEDGKRYHCEFDVVTEDGYEFTCSCQGDFGKNLRSSNDLRVLGRWIKGHMENVGALNVGEPVTDEILQRFGHTALLLQKTSDNKWFLCFE